MTRYCRCTAGTSDHPGRSLARSDSYKTNPVDSSAVMDVTDESLLTLSMLCIDSDAVHVRVKHSKPAARLS